jgi:hypothetical protein
VRRGSSGRDPASRHFAKGLTPRERAAFEAGIALATIYHSLVGLPMPRTAKGRGELAKGVASAVLSQPFRRRVVVRLRGRRAGRGPYSYGEIGERDVSAEVFVEYGGWVVRARLGYVRSLGYPLMRIVEVRRSRKGPGR